MFDSWGRVVYRRRRLVLEIVLIAVALVASWSTAVFGQLQTSGGFVPPGSQSERASSLAAAAFGGDAGDVVVLYSSPTQTVRSPAFRAAVTSVLARLPRSRADSVATYWSTRSPQFVSASGRETYALIELAGSDDSARRSSYDAIRWQLLSPWLQTEVGGVVPANEAISQEVTSDIGRAEAFSLPVLLIVLLVIFGSLAAASLPLAIGGIAILGSFTALRLLTLVTAVSIYSINITTILGLGLGIDYGLFLVSRFREELHSQRSVEDAVARTVATAGRTVAVSGITVATALASLMLFPENFLRSMGYGGVATVLVDMAAALTVMPALLALLGRKVNALRIRDTVPRRPAAARRGGWFRLARNVMRYPLAYAIPIVVVLLLLGSPFQRVAWGGTDATVLPADAAPRLVTEALNRDFPANPTAPIESVVQFSRPLPGSPARRAALAAYVSRLGHVPVDIRYGPGPYSPQARAIVAQVRDVAPPPDARAYVGGPTAQLVDELSSLGQILPWMGLVVGLATFVLLFLAFGSVVLPVKAIAMNVLSLSAMYGVVVWIFQEGHLSRLLQFTPTGTIDPTMPILMFAIMFGLSMDYEVFLLSRIRERYDSTGRNALAVASGLQRTGGLITSLALLLIIVVGAFSASGITFIKLLGVGMIVALIVDATIVRVLLVPAVMRLLGRANWWAPRPLRRLYGRYGIREADAAGPAAPVLARR